jgi:hypothetical protein
MTSPTYTIGIDPGVTGAWVLLENGKYFKSGKFPKREDGLIDHYTLYDEIIDRVIKYIVTPPTYIEKPFALSVNGGVETIWRNYQSVYLAFSHKGVDPTEILPKEWQKILAFDKIDKKIKGKERKQLIKQRALDFATRQEPKINWYNIGKKDQTLTTVNDGLVDAYCIAYAGYLIESL